MFKKAIAITTLLILALALAACSVTVKPSGDATDSGKPATNSPNGGAAAVSPNDSGGAFVYGDGEDYIANHLKGDYSITYRVTSSGTEAYTTSVTRTAEGYYFNISGGETLYIKNGDAYEMYAGSAENGFTKSSFGTFDRENVEMMGAAFTGYMTQYAGFGQDMKPDGSETVAGRACDKFTYQNAALGAAVKFSYSIDRETGVCLKYAYDAAAGGQSGNMTFECTEFKTSGVTLPAYSDGESANTPQSGGAAQSGSLTLDALKQAAKSAGFATDDSRASTSNFEGTTPQPVRGFCIAAPKADGSNTLDIYVNEFASEQEVRDYVDYVYGREYNSDTAYYSGVFCVQFIGDEAQAVEDGLIAAFLTVGW